MGERRVEAVDVVELNRDGSDRREGALVGAAKESERRTGRFEVLHPGWGPVAWPAWRSGLRRHRPGAGRSRARRLRGAR